MGSFRKNRFYLLILMMKTPNFDSKSHTPSKFGENVRRSAKMCEFRKNDRKCNEKKMRKNIYICYFFQNLKSCKLKVRTLQKQRFRCHTSLQESHTEQKWRALQPWTHKICKKSVFCSTGHPQLDHIACLLRSDFGISTQTNGLMKRSGPNEGQQY